jgi:hypothetical protein
MMAERIESFKASIIGGLCVFIALALTGLLNVFVLNRFSVFNTQQINIFEWHLWVSASIVLFSGFLFGVTYRYIIRTDDNLQLKAGGVMAFALVRGLAQIDIQLPCAPIIFNLNAIGANSLLLAENIFLFGLAAKGLDVAIRAGWIKAHPLTTDLD